MLVLSNDTYNQQSADVLVCGLTSNLKPAPYTILIDVTDVERPYTLKHKSKIKVDTIASLEKTLIIKPIARLNLPVFQRVVEEITELIAPFNSG